MIQQLLFDDKEKATPKARPKVTGFRLEDLLIELPEEPKSPEPDIVPTPKKAKWLIPLSLLTEAGNNIKGTWAAPLLGLLVYTLFIGLGLIAVFYLIGLIFQAAGFLIGGAINVAFDYPVLLIILLCLAGGLYFLAASKGEESTEVKPVVEDNTGLFD